METICLYSSLLLHKQVASSPRCNVCHTFLSGTTVLSRSRGQCHTTRVIPTVCASDTIRVIIAANIGHPCRVPEHRAVLVTSSRRSRIFSRNSGNPLSILPSLLHSMPNGTLTQTGILTVVSKMVLALRESIHSGFGVTCPRPAPWHSMLWTFDRPTPFASFSRTA